jgi:hypothetical protein
VEWIELADDGDQWREFTNTVLYPHFPWCRNFMTSRATINKHSTSNFQQNFNEGVRYIFLWVMTPSIFRLYGVELLPITVAARSKAWTVFARSNSGIVGSNLTRGMDVSLLLFCVCVVLCLGSGLATGWSPVQGVIPTVYRLRNCKSWQGPTKRYKAIDR